MQIQQYHSLSQQHITGSQSMKLVSAKQFRYITKKDSDSDLVQISCKQLCSQWWTKLQQPAVVPGVLAHLLFPLPSSTLSPSPPFTASTLSHQLSSLPFFISPYLPLLFLTSFTSFLSHAFISHPQIQLRVWGSAVSSPSRLWGGNPVKTLQNPAPAWWHKVYWLNLVLLT